MCLKKMIHKIHLESKNTHNHIDPMGFDNQEQQRVLYVNYVTYRNKIPTPKPTHIFQATHREASLFPQNVMLNA